MRKIPFSNFLIAVTGVNLVFLIFVLTLRNRLPPVVPLFFGKPVGEEQLKRSIFLTAPALFSILVVLVNGFLIITINKDLIRKVLLATILLTTILGIIAIIKITGLVGSVPW